MKRCCRRCRRRLALIGTEEKSFSEPRLGNMIDYDHLDELEIQNY